MKHFRLFAHVLVYCVGAALVPSALWAGEKFPHAETYMPSFSEAEKYKAYFDDPRPFFETFGLKAVLPPEFYKHLCHDPEKMKSLWSELVGFKAPEVVGKVAPEIKPGKYTYQDLEKYPGLKELMYPDLYNRIKPGGPPHGGSIPEFEIIPTRQYYWAMPIAEATKQNLGKTQLDEDGYIEWQTWLGGYPFPQPSGKFKGQQIIYNIEKRYTEYGRGQYIYTNLFGCDRELKFDFEASGFQHCLAFAGRVLWEPYDWFDERAREEREHWSMIVKFLAPRDMAGTVDALVKYLDPEKEDQHLTYISFMRRIRKLSATDTQDPIAGQDIIRDDEKGFGQRLSKTRFPYKYEVIQEREYLVPALSLDGSEYISSKGLEFRNIKMERRPVWVLLMTQLDPAYVYSKRILLVDKETLHFHHVANFDRKGRLYRTCDALYPFFPEMGLLGHSVLELFRDHVDIHTSGGTVFNQGPAILEREDVSMGAVIRYGK